MAEPLIRPPLATAEPVPAVIVDDVHIRYRLPARGPAAREVHAVRGVTFVARRGETIGLIGSNGSGKSSLLRAIAGLIPADQGRVYTAGRPALLSVGAALMSDLTGERNVWLGGLASGMTPAQVRATYASTVEFSGVNEKGDFIGLPMKTYSSGMAARLRFAIATARGHDVLLIDEALATGDRAFQQRSRERIQELAQQAGTVLLVSHSTSAIRQNCERVIWLERGRLVLDGPAQKVLAAYDTGGASSRQL